MKKNIFLLFCALILTGLASVSAMAQLNTHSVWTNDNGLVIFDPQLKCEYTTLKGFDMASSWTELTPGYPAQAHFRGISKAYGVTRPCGNHFFEFTLVKSAGTDPDTIKGYWDVSRDGVLVCSACDGNAYGMSQPAGVGNYYKLIIDDPLTVNDWYYVGYIDQRKDF
jgi:hypothetical protein